MALQSQQRETPHRESERVRRGEGGEGERTNLSVKLSVPHVVDRTARTTHDERSDAEEGAVPEGCTEREVVDR